MSVAALNRLRAELDGGYSDLLVETPSVTVQQKEPLLNRLRNTYDVCVEGYINYIKRLGFRHKVIPTEVSDGVIRYRDIPDFEYLSKIARDYGGRYFNYAKEKVTDFFSKTQDVIPYFWHNIKVGVADLPGWYVKMKNGAVKKITGVLGVYIPKLKTVLMDRCLMTDNYIGASEQLKQDATSHEFFHAAQDQAGTIDWAQKYLKKPVETIEGEATIFGGGEKHGVYETFVDRYRRKYGNAPITNFDGHKRGYIRDIRDTLSEAFVPAPAQSYREAA